MDNKIKYLLIVFSVLVVGFFFSFITPGQALADNMKPLLVEILNIPLPVTGSVDVNNLPPVKEPVQISFYDKCSTNGFGCGFDVYTVPTGKRLVIEYYTFWVENLTEPDPIEPYISTTLGGINAYHRFVPSSEAVNGLGGGSVKSVNFAENVKLYADPDTIVRMGFRRVQAISEYGYWMYITISGYLEPVP